MSIAIFRGSGMERILHSYTYKLRRSVRLPSFETVNLASKLGYFFCEKWHFNLSFYFKTAELYLHLNLNKSLGQSNLLSTPLRVLLLLSLTLAIRQFSLLAHKISSLSSTGWQWNIFLLLWLFLRAIQIRQVKANYLQKWFFPTHIPVIICVIHRYSINLIRAVLSSDLTE